MSEIKSNRAWREECESMRQQLASRDAEIEELAAALESLIDMDVAYQRGRKVVEAVENACAVLAKVRKP